MNPEDLQIETVKSFLQKILDTELFTIGQTPVTLISLGIAIFTFLVLVILSNLIIRSLSSRLLSRLKLEESKIYSIKRILHYTLVALSLIISLSIIGINLRGVTVIFGLLSVGIGFGLQNITSNFISGLILLFERHVELNDTVTVGDTLGDVVEINMRATTIRTLQNIAIIVPNSEFISSRVINWSYGDPKIRLDIDVGVSYNSDLDLVFKALLEAGIAHPETLDDPKPDVVLKSFGDSAWDMVLRVWIQNARGQYKIRSEINCTIVRKFREYNIEIPFPQSDVHLKDTPSLPVQLSQDLNSSRSEN